MQLNEVGDWNCHRHSICYFKMIRWITRWVQICDIFALQWWIFAFAFCRGCEEFYDYDYTPIRSRRLKIRPKENLLIIAFENRDQNTFHIAGLGIAKKYLRALCLIPTKFARGYSVAQSQSFVATRSIQAHSWHPDEDVNSYEYNSPRHRSPTCKSFWRKLCSDEWDEGPRRTAANSWMDGAQQPPRIHEQIHVPKVLALPQSKVSRPNMWYHGKDDSQCMLYS
jgi:hypothetical protein